MSLTLEDAYNDTDGRVSDDQNYHTGEIDDINFGRDDPEAIGEKAELGFGEQLGVSTCPQGKKSLGFIVLESDAPVSPKKQIKINVCVPESQ